MVDREFEKVFATQIDELSKRIDGLRSARDEMKGPEPKYARQLTAKVFELQATRTAMKKALAAFRKTMKE